MIAKNWVNEAVDHLRNTFLMDYASTMEECSSHVHINVMSLEEIDKAVSAMKLYGIEKGSKEIAHSVSDLSKANNKIYQPQEVLINLNKPDEVFREIEVELKQST